MKQRNKKLSMTSMSSWRTLTLGLSALLIVPLSVQAGNESSVSEIATVAQAKTMKGRVVDENGEPLIGVTVRVAGTNDGTITDMDGNFTIALPQGKNSLTFSYAGYKTKTMKVTGSSVDVTLEPDVLGLEDVVVIGYGSMKKRDLTGSISSVSSDVVKLTPSSNPMESLQGRISGLDMVKTSGQAGSGISMQLRGNRSISASGSPLVLVDGMPGDINTLNPNDIETIEVLKDASSTAVYGSEGANGVIIVTTKKAKEGKLSVNFNAYYGYNGWSTMPKMNNAEQFVYTRLLAQKEAGVIEDEDLTNRVAEEALERGAIVDWTDALLKAGSTQNYSLSLSGGTQKTQAYFSLNYSREKGQFANDKYDVFSSTVRINHEMNKWFSAGLHMQGSYTDQEKSYSKLENALRANPFGNLYNEDGTVAPFPIPEEDKLVSLLVNENPDVYRNHPNKFNIYFQPYLRITPLKGLTLETRLSARLGYTNNHQFTGYGSYSFYDNAGRVAIDGNPKDFADLTSATLSGSRTWGYTWENILTYNFTLKDDHTFTLTAASTYNDSQNEGWSLSNTGVPSNTMYWTNMNALTGNNRNIGSSYSMGKTLGYVARLNYSFLSRYLLSVSMRWDANSKLSPDVRWNSFPAISAGWRISDEPFMQSASSWLDNLKLRVGYGETGGAGISAYDTMATLEAINIGLGDQVLQAYTFGKMLNTADLTWERSKSTNIGIDAAFLGGRIDLALDYYVTNTDGVIWKQNIPISNGGYNATTLFQVQRNIASTRNRGLELTLNTRNIQTKDFTWTSTLTYFTNKEEVTDLGEGAAEFIENGNYTLTVGHPIRSYRAFKFNGVWQKGEEADAAVFGKLPGDLKVDVPNMTKISDGVWQKVFPDQLDEDGNPIVQTYDAENPYSVNALDMQMIGHQSPDWSLGFQNTFTYKGFDLSIYLYTRHGQMFYYEPITWYSSSGGAFPAHFDYWLKDHPSNEFPALDSSRNWKSDEYYTSLAWVDGSFFKIKNITLGYTLPATVCRSMRISNLRVYGTITNPYVWAKNDLLKDYDPEMGGSLDFPLTKQLVFGVNLSF